MSLWSPVLALLVSATLSSSGGVHAGSARSQRAAALFASSGRRIAAGTHEQRQFAVRELQEAVQLDPTRSDIALALGRLYLEADLLGNARAVARRVTAMDTVNADAWLLEGEVWRRYWLTESDETCRDRAIVCLARSVRLAPSQARALGLLAPLLVDAGELPEAHEVAAWAVRVSPGDPAAQVQLAAAAQRTGDLPASERLFRSGVPRLAAGVREHYESVAPLLPPSQLEMYLSLDPQARRSFNERFWADNDPDPVSPENEARLEYWTRVTHAASLYGTSRPGEWDMRAQYYVRFGRPTFEEINPITMPGRLHQGDWLAWTYTDLGLRVWMGTMSSFHGFSEPVSNRAVAARAWPESLARHDELYPLHRGWAVLHKLPPGAKPLPTGLTFARFQAQEGDHLLVQAEAPGEPGDSLSAEWVVLDSAYTAVARNQRAMATSACGLGPARAASFTATLPEGRYCVGVRVSDPSGPRQVIRRNIVVSRPTSELALSDLVVTCSPANQSIVGGSAVRLEPQTGLFPARGDELNAYFEIYRLAQVEGGDARFEYECVVRPVLQDRRGWLSRVLHPLEAPPPIAMSRAETTRGSMRRQFLSVPVGSLPTGTYEIAVLVRDATNGATAKAVASFARQR